MNQRKLPAKRDQLSVWPVPVILGLMIYGQFQLLAYVVEMLSLGYFGLGAIMLFINLVVLWITGALYVTLPLTLYFHVKYRNPNPDFNKIERVHKRALRFLEKLPVRRHISAAANISNLGLLRLCQGEYESAEEFFTTAIEYLDKCKDAKRSSKLTLIVLINNLAVAYLRQNKVVEAELAADRALSIAETPEMQQHYKIVEGAPLAVRAAAHLRLGEYEEALKIGKQVLEIYEKSPVPKLFTSSAFVQAKAFCYLGLSLATLKLGQKLQSLEYFQAGIELVRDNQSQINTLALEPLNNLASEYLENKMFEVAEPLLEIAYRLGRDNPYHPDARTTLGYFEKLLLLTDRQDEVTDMKFWLRPVECKLLSQDPTV